MKPIVLLLRLLLAAAALGTSMAATLPENVQTLGSELRAGAMVAAERIGDKVRYTVAGHLEPAGVPPEKVIFEIGSISKVFTCLLLAQAVTEGKVSLDTTLKDLLGNEVSFADPQIAAITLQQLATHTSGLPRLPDDWTKAPSTSVDPYSGYDHAKLMTWLQAAHLQGKPPFAHSYSNLGVGLLGDVLSRLYGPSWEALVVEKIAKPLRMVDTAITLSPEQQQRFAPGYAGDGQAAVHWAFQSSALAGCGALRSTLSDLVTFSAALMQPEKTPLKAALQLLEQRQMTLPGGGGIGLGLMLGQRDDEPTLWHNGGTAGFRSLLEVTPGLQRICVALCNNGDARIDEVLTGPVSAPPALAAYEGVYQYSPTIRYTVQWRGPGVGLAFKVSGQGFSPMFKSQAADTFHLRSVRAEIEFTREAGAVTAVTLKQNGREYHAVKQP